MRPLLTVEPNRVVVERARNADAGPAQPLGVEERPVVASRRRFADARRGIVRIGCRALHPAQQDGGVGHGATHRARRVVVEGDRRDPPAADPSQRRADPHQHVGVRRADDRAAGVGPDVGGPEARRGPDPGAGSPGTERRPAIEGGRTRIAPRVVGVVGEAGQRVVVAGHGVGRARHPVCEFGEARLGNDDRAGLAKVGGQRGLVGRDESVEGERAGGGGEVGRVDVVLERDGDAVKRSPHVPARPLRVQGVGFRQGVFVDRDGGVEPLFVERDADQVLGDELPGGEFAALHRGLEVGDGGLHDREGLGRRGRSGAGGESEGRDNAPGRSTAPRLPDHGGPGLATVRKHATLPALPAPSPGSSRRGAAPARTRGGSGSSRGCRAPYQRGGGRSARRPPPRSRPRT